MTTVNAYAFEGYAERSERTRYLGAVEVANGYAGDTTTVHLCESPDGRILAVRLPVSTKCEVCDRPARYCGETHEYRRPRDDKGIPVERRKNDLRHWQTLEAIRRKLDRPLRTAKEAHKAIVEVRQILDSTGKGDGTLVPSVIAAVMNAPGAL